MLLLFILPWRVVLCLFSLVVLINNMSSVPYRYCVFGCNSLVLHGVPLHRFPNPEKRPQLFAAWVSAVGDKLRESDPKRIYRNKRMCDHHFESCTKISGSRLIGSAVPTINLHCVKSSVTTIVEIDHSYCLSRRQGLQSRNLADITNLPGPSSAVNTTVFPIPSGSSSMTCFSASDKCGSRTKTKRFDADTTFEHLIEKAEKKSARKERKNLNEIRRLRLKVKHYRLRLREQRRLAKLTHFQKFTENMTESAKMFTRMQCMEGKKKKQGRRFTEEEKIMSLSIYKKSPKAYKLLSKHFTLPTKKVLKVMLSKIKLRPGINAVVFKELQNTVSKMLPQDRLCTLIFDEMSITPQIQYNVYTDDLVGFENFGNDEKTEKIANHVLVFMVKGIRKKFKQPVAYYFTQALKSNKLKEILNEVVKNVQATGLTVVATVCDQSSVNVSTINNLVTEAKRSYLKVGKEFKKDVIIINKREIIPLFDPPHLLKGIRNNLINKEIKYVIDNNTKSVNWEDFLRVFEADRSHGELRLLPKLTIEHVDPQKIRKMRVKNAAQLLSFSMAVATDNLVARGSIPAKCKDLIPFVLLIDKLFDSLNASSFSVQNGKIYRAAIKLNSPHHKLWQDAIKLLKSVKFFKQNNYENIERSVPTVKNFIKTIEGFKSIWQLLHQKYRFDAMLTRNFNQDPLENFFGNIRSLGSRNVSPNCLGFEGAFKTLLLNNYSSNHSINSNCEEDSNECLQSLSFLIKNKENSAAPKQSQSIVIDQPLEVIQSITNICDSGADQRIYVCGWALSKCLKKVVKGCKKCKGTLLGNPENDICRYIRSKEYSANKKWLCYPSNCLVACFQEIQNVTVAFLNNECYKKNIKERIKNFIDLFIDFNFIDCEHHVDDIKKCFVDTSINIIIYSWCRSINRILEGKISYDGEDAMKKSAQIYYNTHKTRK